jgi:hypothetical protein
MGELSVRIHNALSAGEESVVAGWQAGHEGRKYYAGSAIYGADGRVVAVGHATWLEIPREDFVTLSRTGKAGA